MRWHGIRYWSGETASSGLENNVKLNKKMKTKTLITGLAVAALMVSSSVVKANAFLEVISGTHFTTISVPSGDNASSSASIGGWNLNYSINGTASGGGGELDVLLNAQTRGATPDHGLTVIYSSGDPYTQQGVWTYGLSESGNNTVGSTAQVYWSHSIYAPPSPAYLLGSLGTALVGPGGQTTLSLPPSVSGGSTAATPAPDTLVSYFITEVLNIGGGSTHANPTGVGGRPSFNGGVTFTAVAVPDGGLTMAFLGSVFLGVACVRSKFRK